MIIFGMLMFIIVIGFAYLIFIKAKKEDNNGWKITGYVIAGLLVLLLILAPLLMHMCGGKGMMGKKMMAGKMGQGGMCQMMGSGGMMGGQGGIMNGSGMSCPMMSGGMGGMMDCQGGMMNQGTAPKNSFEMFKNMMMKQEPMMDDKMMDEFIKAMKEDKAFFEKFKGMLNK